MLVSKKKKSKLIIAYLVVVDKELSDLLAVYPLKGLPLIKERVLLTTEKSWYVK
jgi:hypothetical protein